MTDSDRRSLRFAPDENNIAEIDASEAQDKDDFQAQVHGLIVDEARDGCCLVLTNNQTLQEGDLCLVKIGRLDPINSEVRWIRELDDEVQKIGLMYLE